MVMKQLFEVPELKHVAVDTCNVKRYPYREAYRFQLGFRFQAELHMHGAKAKWPQDQNTSYGCFLCEILVVPSFSCIYGGKIFGHKRHRKPLFSRAYQVASSCFEGC